MDCDHSALEINSVPFSYQFLLLIISRISDYSFEIIALKLYGSSVIRNLHINLFFYQAEVSRSDTSEEGNRSDLQLKQYDYFGYGMLPILMHM